MNVLKITVSYNFEYLGMSLYFCIYSPLVNKIAVNK